MCIRDYIRRKTTRVASQVSEVTNEQQQTLMPTVINENEPQYLPVREIGEKLDTDNLIRNIALTGPYGSGKSTVLYTLQQDYKKHTYLQISLATLESYDLLERDEKKKDKKDIEQLNRLIEYSILQQLIYREKYATVPNSRIKRIFHFDNWKLFGWTVGILLFFIAFLIAFEPSWLRVETMYRILDMGPVANSVADILSVLYMLFGISVCIRKILSAFCGYQLSRFNLKDGEVELKEASIFNKHLDEIIYFFQRTKYDVVIIEDLDRFNTSDIYLKLRELNQLINESKEIGRHIVFIYAVKDDVFKDEQRAKFFDYITTVIPIINPSNSKDKLKEALRLRGYEDIADDDLEEMAFFINDMRLLQNIANEYQQYRTRLCATGQITLNPTKLLGMIVYKNYFPKDFAQLHNREGDVYKCIAMKPKFIVYALQQLDEQKKQLEQKIKEYYHSAHIAKNDLREICAYQIIAEMPQKPQTIKIEQKYQSLKEVIKDEELFEQMISEDQIDYQYHHILYGTQPANFNLVLERITTTDIAVFANYSGIYNGFRHIIADNDSLFRQKCLNPSNFDENTYCELKRIKTMLLGDKIKELREEHGVLQRQLAALLDIDTPMFSKIERGDRYAKRTQVIQLAEYFNIDKNELLTLWLADKVLDAIEDEDELKRKAIEVAQERIG